MENLAAVLTKAREFTFEKREIPSPKNNEVLIQIKTVGICGSDVHYFKHLKCGGYEVKKPIVLGHESAGIVVEVGAGVTHLAKGDRVAIEPGVPCRTCNHCKKGRYNLCQDVVFLATPPYDGSLSNYIVHAADFCYKLPDNVSFSEGALMEPLSVGLFAVERGNIRMGDSVLIIGAGPIGLTTLLACKAAGASTIIITDIQQRRLDVAQKLGASHPFLANKTDLVECILEATGGHGVDATFDCSGIESAIVSGLKGTKAGGKFLSIGRGHNSQITIPNFFELMDKEIDLIGVFRYANMYQKALDLLASKRIEVEPLFTHSFDFKDVESAFLLAERGDGIKIAVNL
jgi:L-iditol 2-dehydrogenase